MRVRARGPLRFIDDLRKDSTLYPDFTAGLVDDLRTSLNLFLDEIVWSERSDFRELLLLGRAEDAETLSGRSLIWPEVLSFAKERLWFGYGYESFWTAGRIDEPGSWRAGRPVARR